MKIIFLRLVPAFFLLILFSCTKHNSPAPVPPAAVDSLFSWQLLFNTGGVPVGQDIWFVSPSKGFFAATDNTIYQSQDSGKSWSKIPNSTSSGFLLNLFFINDQYGFAQGPGQLEVTRDGGNTWSFKKLASSNGYNIFFTTPASGYYGDAIAGLYKTSDTGNTWTLVYQPAGSSNGYYPYFRNANTGYVFSGNGYFGQSTDSGVHWQTVSQTSIVSQLNSFNSLQFIDSLTGFFAGPSGLLKTTDAGQSWHNINPAKGPINVVKFFDTQTGYYLAASVIYKTVNGGQTWATSCKLANNNIFAGMHFISPTTGWTCTSNGYILRINQ